MAILAILSIPSAGVYIRWQQWGGGGPIRKEAPQVLKVLFTMLIAAAIAAPTASAAKPPKPLPPEQAGPLVNAPGTGGVDSAPVSKATALAAMQSPSAAVSIDGTYATAAAAVAAATGCASYDSHWSWGTFPYEHGTHAVTYFCAVYGDHITGYSTTVMTDQTLCSRTSADRFTYSGGVGYSWVTIQANASWNCPIIGFIPWSVGAWLRTAYNAWGNAQIVDHS